ncbi:MAG: class I SAM-dependent methyltransferase [Thermoguttaceae bacterium]
MHHSCLACGCRITWPLYRPKPQPLAALNLPRTPQAARSALRFPMDWQVCGSCGHIFNTQFDYYRVPYKDNSNLMYNRGPLWLEHLGGLIEALLGRYGAAGKTLVDIGCGDGIFFKLLLERSPDCRCIGFEPGIEAENARRTGAVVYQDYFHPERDLKRIRADFLVCRHVIEHLADPREFVGAIAYWCNRYEQYPIFLAEVPQIDKAIRQGRLTDLLYEHVSNFTAASFRTMLKATGFELLEFRRSYDDEVAVAFVRPKRLRRLAAVRQRALAFRRLVHRQLKRVQQQLGALRAAGRSVAFWGGTGKGAAFLNTFEIRAEQFPLVVDSDPHKLGRFVPGTAQPIRGPEYLLEHPVEVIVITTRWRARDIADEIRRLGIRCQEIWVLGPSGLQPYQDGLARSEKREVESAKQEKAPGEGGLPGRAVERAASAKRRRADGGTPSPLPQPHGLWSGSPATAPHS